MTDDRVPIPAHPPRKATVLRLLWGRIPPRGTYLRPMGPRSKYAYRVLKTRQSKPGAKSLGTLICRRLLKCDIPRDAKRVMDWKWAPRRLPLRSPLR